MTGQGRPEAGALDRLARKVSAADGMANSPQGWGPVVEMIAERIDAARAGRLPPVPPTRETVEAAPTRSLVAHRPFPDFATGDVSGTESFSRKQFEGRPFLAVYYHVDSPRAESLLKFAQALQAAHPQKLRVVALAKGGDTKAFRQKQAWELAYPVLSGTDWHARHGIESTPRMALVDAEGNVRHVCIGWDGESAEWVSREVERLCR